jgi:Na+:H+ antiporter, NhaC family
LNLIIPFISILYAVTGFTIVKLTEEEKAEQLELEKDEKGQEEVGLGIN